MPIKWSVSIVRKAMKDKRFANAPAYTNLVKSIAAFRKGLSDVVSYGHVTVPLVYTQVLTNQELCKHNIILSRLFILQSTSTLLLPLWDVSG